MFSDDDDVLHPARCAAYLSALERAPPESHAVSAAWVARPKVCEEGVHSAADVERLVASGRVVKTPEQLDAKGGGGSWDEYWNVALRLATGEPERSPETPEPRRTLVLCTCCNLGSPTKISTTRAARCPRAPIWV